ncbi:hypothetical protein [Streptomyces beihaiensis]|uniref:Lipoprotein n=1 Tax=Streptomyces beihaiensis TaxID=2984495 RepID=A0ABT3TUY5_9ACTN|nr:hypothetical protein [Streptomyces beihaiensis]MCX3060824.1 hypothetical protein [Streptomyces beihaiensis]
MLKSSVRGAAVVVVALAAFSVSCSTSSKAARTAADGSGTSVSASTSASPSAPLADSASPAIPVEKVRDAFAGLQATLNDSCTPGNCAYFLGRVYDELHRMDRAMKADPQGPGHFAEPIRWIKKLDARLGGDRSFENLKKHQTSLIGTRDKINTWMQGHPEDYR